MKIKVLKNLITDSDTFNEGIALVKQITNTILPMDITVQDTSIVFTSQTYTSPIVGTGYSIPPEEILDQVDGTDDIVFLIFDNSDIDPKPLNPVCSFVKKGNTIPCQMASEWYQGAENTFEDYFLHEICHAESFRRGKTDITHLLTDGTLQAQYPALYAKFSTQPPSNWYLYLLNGLVNVPTEGNLPPDDSSHMFNTSTGALNPLYTGLHAPTTNANPVTVASHPKIDLWCSAIKIMEGAKPELNNPGNLRFVGQQFAVNEGGFCKFDTYEHGYEALQNMLINACAGKSHIYNSDGDLYAFYALYAPSSDNNNPRQYTEFVAQHIGVSPTIIIKNLL